MRTIFAGNAAEPDGCTREESRLKAGCSQDWLPHKSSLNAEIFALPEDLAQVALEDLAGAGLRQRLVAEDEAARHFEFGDAALQEVAQLALGARLARLYYDIGQALTEQIGRAHV